MYSVGDLIKNNEIDIYYYVEKAEQEYTIRQICTDIKTTLAQEVLEASPYSLYRKAQ